MSEVILKDIDLIFKPWKAKRIKDILVPGSNKFSSFNDGAVHSIKNVNLSIRDGDRVAIIGHNGAGKSTLLKLISGIYTPTNGKIEVIGKISSMLDFAGGFEMELTGWDNIYLRGLMLGETPQSIKKKMKEIAEFSELGDFLNMPVKYYSSGMFIRLAFSVSTSIKPDILLLDEVIAAGDAAFLEKANERIHNMIHSSRILILVTHSMESAIKMCNRCIWMEKGEILMDGNPENVTRAYIENVRKTEGQ